MVYLLAHKLCSAGMMKYFATTTLISSSHAPHYTKATRRHNRCHNRAASLQVGTVIERVTVGETMCDSK